MDYGHPVRFGVFITPVAMPDHSLAVAALADELSFDLIGLQDHPYQSRFLDTWTLLTTMAMRTKRIQVFPDVANLPLRPPAAALRRSRQSAARCGLGGNPSTHPIGIWLLAYKPRMLALVGRAADGWVPSPGYAQPPDLLEGNRRIDEAAAAAGRDPKAKAR